jgi:hypothetical protein
MMSQNFLVTKETAFFAGAEEARNEMTCLIVLGGADRLGWRWTPANNVRIFVQDHAKTKEKH